MNFVRKNPIFFIGFIDSAIQPFTLLLSPLFFISAMIHKHWTAALLIAVWWAVSRTVKLLPHLKVAPWDILLIPVYIPFTFYSAVVKIYSLVSLNTQSWITRWDKNRLAKFSYIHRYSRYSLTLFLVLFMGAPVLSYESTYKEQVKIVDSGPIPEEDSENMPKNRTYTPIVSKHLVEPGEYLITIAQKYGVDPADIVKYNFNILPNWNVLEVGTVLTIPLKNNHFEPVKIFEIERAHLPASEVLYDANTNTLSVNGRGTNMTIQQLAEQDNFEHIKELKPKVWFVSSNILIGNGVSFNVSKDQVDWLRFKSGGGGFVHLDSRNGRMTFDGIKVTSWDEVKNTPGHGDILEQIEKAKKTSLEGKVQEH